MKINDSNYYIKPEEWELINPYGPLVHTDTGMSYQELMAHMELKEILRKQNHDQ